MKNLLIILFFIFIGCASTTYRFGETIPEQANVHSLLTNTIVQISAVNPIDSSIPQSAKNAIFVVKENVLDNYGNLIIRSNTNVPALITINSRGNSGRSGKISILFQQIKDVRGRTIYFDNNPIELEGISRKGMSVGLTVGMFFAIFPVNFAFLAIEGDDVSIPAGYIFKVKIR